MTSTKPFILLLLILALTGHTQSSWAQAPRTKALVTKPNGTIRSPNLADLKPHIYAKGGYVENWTYAVYLDSDVQLYLNYTLLDLGMVGGPSSGADLTIVGLEDANYFVARKYDIEDLSFNDETQKLSVNKEAWFEGPLPDRHRIYFKTTKRGVSYLVDLEFSEIESGLVLGDGTYQFSKRKKIGLFIHIPRATVRGTVSVNDTTIEVSGTAFMDHFFQSRNLINRMCCGFQYVRHDEDWEVASLFAIPNGTGTEALGYGLANGEGGPLLITPESLTIEEYTKLDNVSLAKRLTIAYDQVKTLNIEWEALDNSRSVLSEIGGLRPFAKFFLGGEAVYFRGRGKLLESGEDLRLNYMVVR